MSWGTSSIMASVYGFLERYFVVTSRIAATFSVLVCCGEFIIPPLVGSYIDVYPKILIYVSLFLVISTCALFATMCVLCSAYAKIVKLLSQTPEEAEYKSC